MNPSHEALLATCIAVVCGLALVQCYGGPASCTSSSDCFDREVCAPAAGECIPCEEAPRSLARNQGCPLPPADGESFDATTDGGIDAIGDDVDRTDTGAAPDTEAPTPVDTTVDPDTGDDQDTGTPDGNSDCGDNSSETPSFRCPTTGTIDYDCDGTFPDPLSEAPSGLPAPIAYWPFNDNASAQPVEQVGRGPALQVSDGGTFTRPQDAPAGRGFGFENANYLKADHHRVFERAEGTVMFWVRVSPDRLGDVTQMGGLFSKDARGPGGGGHLTILAVGTNSDGVKIRARLAGDTKDDATWLPPLSNSSTYPRGTWHHVAVTFGSAGFQLYVNGDQVGRDQTRTHGLWSQNGVPQNVQPLGVGIDRSDADDGEFQNLRNHFPGDIDELALFDEQFDPGPYVDSCRP